MSEIQNKELIELAGSRNGFMPAAMKQLTRIAIFNSAVTGIMILGVSAVFIFQPAPQTFAITPDGRVVKMIPLNQGIGQDGIADFVGRAVLASYSIDFMNWENQLGSLSQYYTDQGFNSFMEAITPLKNRVVEGRFITSVGYLKAPIIVRSGVVDGVMKYKIRAVISIGFEGQASRISTQSWAVDIVAERVPSNQSLNGIKISSIVAKPFDVNQ